MRFFLGADLQSTDQTNRQAKLQLIAFAVLNAIAVYSFAVLHGYSRPVESSTTMPISAAHGWVLLQSFLLVMPALLLGILANKVLPRIGFWGGVFLIGLTSIAYTLDVVAFNSFNERLLSDTTAKVVWVLLPGLLTNLNAAIAIVGLLAFAATATFFLVAYYVSAVVAARIVRDQRQSSKWQVVGISMLMLSGLAAIPLTRGTVTFDEMRSNSDRNPLCATCMVGHVNRGVPAPKGDAAVAGSIRALGASQRLQHLEVEYPKIRVRDVPTDPPDILLVVIESFRRETIEPRTAPNLYALAQRGIWAQNHISSSNATNMGMFSALYGLEAVWFDRGIAWKPAMNRLLSEANYRLGFFGGSENWDLFQMQTFINPELYDSFSILPVDWTKSDLAMRDKTIDFFDAPEPDAKKRRPRCALLYLYCTHFDYHSEPQDQVHQPAAKGQLTTAYGPATRDQIWNRYLNSVRFVDRILEPLLTDDRVVVVIGDHGEAFLEDECRLHGIKISEFQNATPAIIAGPGIKPAIINHLTSHTDILPTLLDAAGISVDGCELFEGTSILTGDLSANRLMITRNYMKPELAILGNQVADSAKPWGHRVYFSIDQWQASPANPIDRYGSEMSEADESSTLSTSEVFERWLELRFGKEAMAKDEDIVSSLKRHLASNRREIVLEALKLSSKISSRKFPQLLDAVADLTSHGDDELRKTSQQVWLEMQRSIKYNR